MLVAQLQAVILKEVRQTIRDRRVMALLLIAPLLQLMVFGLAVDFDVDRVPTCVVDMDESAASREHIRRFLADGTLVEVVRRETPEEAEHDLVSGLAAVAVVIPPGFGQALARGAEPASMAVMIDGSNPTRSGVAGNAASLFARSMAREAIEARLQRMGSMAPEIPAVPSAVARVLYNPTLETNIYMVPGIAAMLLLVVTTIVTAMGLARERESGTLEQVLVTPVRPWILLGGKMLPFAVIGIVDYLLAMVVGSYVFGMPIRGNLFLLTGATALYLVATLAMGLFISTISRTQQQAFLGGFLFMMPAVLLSGIMTPIYGMPDWLQPFTLLNPLRHYADIMRAVLLRGAGPEEIAPQLVGLAVIGGVIGLLAVSRFRKTLV